MELIPAKTILSKTKFGSEWFGIDYGMNLYKGCCHNCIYCDSRSECYRIESFSRVRLKEEAISILEKELISKREKGVIGLGAMSDTYNPFEKEYEITRQALELIYKYNYGVSIDTKSNLITRDIDILEKINEKNDVIIKLTITTSDDKLSKIIEPDVCISSERFKVIKELSGKGIYVGILMNPVLPYITDNEQNIKGMVRLAHENGAKFIHTFMGVTLRDRQRDYYYQMLDKHFPDLKDKYIKKYGNNYICEVPNAKYLYKVFTNECDKYKILYNMEDIIKGYKRDKEEVNQISLFK